MANSFHLVDGPELSHELEDPLPAGRGVRQLGLKRGLQGGQDQGLVQGRVSTIRKERRFQFCFLAFMVL